MDGLGTRPEDASSKDGEASKEGKIYLWMSDYHPDGGQLFMPKDPTWHNGVYIKQEYSPAAFLTRQGRVHARVSASWADEFNCLLRVPLDLPNNE